MSQVGVAACPKCGARYGVQAQVAGQTVPCPACGTAFVVMPVARAPDDFLPPSVDLAAGGPIVPASRVLEPVVYPHRDIPWVMIAAGTALCLVLGLILFGGWQAYRAIDAAIANSSSEQGELASSAASDLGAGAVADTADQVASDAAAAVAGAGKVIDRVASAVTDSIEVPKILPDSHDRCADERERLQADYVKIREEFAGGKQIDTAKKLLDLQLRTEDLAIRWYLLPPMTEAERDRLKPRLFEQIQRGFGGNPIGEPDAAFDSEPSARMVAISLNNSVRSVTLAIAMSVSPPKAEGLFEQKCAELADGSREMCKQLYSVHSPADIDRIAPRVQEEIARIKTTSKELGQLDGAAINLSDQASMQRISNLMAKIGMVTIVVNHVSLRFGLAHANPSASEESRRAAEGGVVEFGKRLGLLMNEYQTAHFELAAAAMRGQLPGGSPNVATSAGPSGGPSFAVPGFGGPGFGMPPGFGPSGFGPPAGFGESGPFGPHPRPSDFSDANIDADFEAKRQAFAQANGADRIVTIRASGGTEGQFRALEATVMRLIRPTSHSMNMVGSRFQMSVVYAGDVERVAAAIRTGKVVSTDVSGRLIVVEIK